MNELRLISKEQLSKSDLKTVIKVINDSARNVDLDDNVVTVTKDKPMAKRYSVDGGYNAYLIELDRAITGDEADSIIGGLYNVLSFDFVVEINSEVDDCEDDYEECVEEKESVQHSKWMQEQLQEGWSYGLEYDEDAKRSPFLRPYHQLTDSQKKVMEKSKKKLGRYGVFVPYVFAGWYGNDTDDSDSGIDGGDYGAGDGGE